MTKQDEQLLEQARTILARGFVEKPPERETIRRAAIALLSNGRVRGPEDVQMVRFARATFGRRFNEPERPPKSTPFDKRVADAEKHVERQRALAAEAEDAVYRAAAAVGALTGEAHVNVGGPTGQVIVPTAARPTRGPTSTREIAEWERRVHAERPGLERKVAEAVAVRHRATEDLERLTAELTTLRQAASRWRATEE